MTFDFPFLLTEYNLPATPLVQDPCLLDISSFASGHVRSSSSNSIFSHLSDASTEASEISASPPSPVRQCNTPICQHGPMLLPKIRNQDQDIQSSTLAPAQRSSTVHKAPSTYSLEIASTPTILQCRATTFHQAVPESLSNPEATINFFKQLNPIPKDQISSSRKFSSSEFLTDSPGCSDYNSEGLVSSLFNSDGYPTYRHIPSYYTSTTLSNSNRACMVYSPMDNFMLPNMSFSKSSSPSTLFAAVKPATISSQSATITLISYLSAANPAPSLVKTLPPLRDLNTKYFWWDVRQVRPWSTFTSQNILSMPGAMAALTTPVAGSLLVMPAAGICHPETESQLYSIYANHYIPRLNNVLAITNAQRIQFAIPSKPFPSMNNLIVAHVPSDSTSVSAIFGGKPSSRIVGLVRSFDRFNTGMRVEGNIKRVKYLRELAALHHAMREHGCRFGFILTEIELVVVRNGNDSTPYFGLLEILPIQLTAVSSGGCDGEQITACLALWGLASMASMDAQTAIQNGITPWNSEIGAPAEGTRRKVLDRESWMPQPQLAEKREAKRARGWVWPQDPIGRKELGKRGVRYASC